jgi:hypothetical protein
LSFLCYSFVAGFYNFLIIIINIRNSTASPPTRTRTGPQLRPSLHNRATTDRTSALLPHLPLFFQVTMFVDSVATSAGGALAESEGANQYPLDCVPASIPWPSIRCVFVSATPHSRSCAQSAPPLATRNPGGQNHRSPEGLHAKITCPIPPLHPYPNRCPRAGELQVTCRRSRE